MNEASRSTGVAVSVEQAAARIRVGKNKLLMGDPLKKRLLIIKPGDSKIEADLSSRLPLTINLSDKEMKQPLN